MYNFKEKKLHFNALRNPDAAAFDLELLQKVSPSHPKLRTFSRDAKRYADDILYALLDFISREDIRGFRRAKQEESLQAAEEEIPDGKVDNSPAAKEDDNEDAKTDAPPTTVEAENNAQSVEEIDSKPASAEQIEELKQSLEETEQRADEAQQRAEEAEESQEEAEQRADEAEERAEAAESALEEEKKKEPPVAAPAKSKSTRSTHKSTGTTSSTRKSK